MGVEQPWTGFALVVAVAVVVAAVVVVAAAVAVAGRGLRAVPGVVC